MENDSRLYSASDLSVRSHAGGYPDADSPSCQVLFPQGVKRLQHDAFLEGRIISAPTTSSLR